MKREIIVSTCQNIVTIDSVKTIFKPANVTKTTCNKCWWLRFATRKECDEIPCCGFERTDRLDGIFTIQNMPGNG